MILIYFIMTWFCFLVTEAQWINNSFLKSFYTSKKQLFLGSKVKTFCYFSLLYKVRRKIKIGEVKFSFVHLFCWLFKDIFWLAIPVSYCKLFQIESKAHRLVKLQTYRRRRLLKEWVFCILHVKTKNNVVFRQAIFNSCWKQW